MRILHVCHHFYPCVGGIEKYVEDLCTNLIALGHECEVVCLNTCAKRKDKLPEFVVHRGIKIHRVPFINFRIYKIAPHVLKFVRGKDVVHIHGLGFFSDILTVTRFFHRKPLVLSTLGGVFHTGSHALLKQAYFNFWCKLTMKGVSRIIAVSKSDEKIFSKFSNVTHIPVGISFGKFASLRKKEEENTLLFVGRISKNKRIDNLIRTVSFLKKQVPGIKLLIVGGDWEGIKNELEGMVSRLGLRDNVVFAGRVDEKELLNYYSRSQLFVTASEFESFGITVLEAMASGMPVVLNDISVFREFVKNNENGFIVDYSKPETAANKIASLLGKNLTQVKHRAQETAENYDWKRIANMIEDVYNGDVK